MKQGLQFFLLMLICFSVVVSNAQTLKPGFSASELLEVMYVSARTGGNEEYVNDSLHPIPEPKDYVMIYRSDEVGFDNLWELWINHSEDVGIITVRGSTAASESWLANFFAAMLPPKGNIVLSSKDTIEYYFANNSKAMVHAGWTISTAFLLNDMLPVLDSAYRSGLKEYIVTGHSQGGAISYLLTSQFRNMQAINTFPKDVVFKTYSTAAPKVANLYFAYEYERAEYLDWAFNVINPLDWVPEMPLAVQTVYDFNPINPFDAVGDVIGRTKPPQRIALRHVYRKLKRHPKRTMHYYRKYLGEKLKPTVDNHIQEIEFPDFVESMNYVRSGESVILTPTGAYHKSFPHNPENIFVHHSHHAYIMLIEEYMRLYNKE
jgi:hypothetical protein